MIGLALFLHFLPELVGLPSPHESGLTAGQVLTHFVYLQNISAYDNLSAGFWTLCIEMQFYLLFCVMLGLAQRLSRRGQDSPTPRAWRRGAGLSAAGAGLALCVQSRRGVRRLDHLFLLDVLRRRGDLVDARPPAAGLVAVGLRSRDGGPLRVARRHRHSICRGLPCWRST